MPSPNQSSRGGQKVRLIVLHTAEGALTYQSLGNYFSSTASQVSSHVGIDNTPNTVGEYVPRNQKAWTAANANPIAVQAELCAFASWSPATWNQNQMMLQNAAAWIAEEAAQFAIPLTRLTPAQAQGSGRGICEHKDLGAWGGNHSDCGPSFPIDNVIKMAGGTIVTPPSPTPSPTLGGNMILVDPISGGTWIVSSREGAVYTLGPAPYLGGTNNNAMNAAKYPCVGIGLRPNNDGYKLVLDWGDAGGGKSADGGTRYRDYNFPRNGSGKATSGTY